MKFNEIQAEKRERSYSEILRSTSAPKKLSLKAERKSRSKSRFSLDPKDNEKPMYKGEIIIDRFLNN